jgi:branched-chain amino acid aminotransferase
MSDLIHFLNGKFVSESELLISPRDLGFSRGYAVHDFIVTYNNQPFKLTEHIDRLFKSAEIIDLKIPWNKTQIINWVKETLDKNDKETEKTVRIYLTGGISESMYLPKLPTLIMIVNQRTRKPLSDYENGVKVKAVRYKRQDPEVKHCNYVEAIKQFSKNDENIAEIIYYDDSQVFEGAGTNIFVIISNKLITPKSNIVYGITRNTILEILKLSIPIEVNDFTFEDLLKATEVFITGSNSEVRGVVEINEKAVGDGKVGKITKEVAKQYKEYIDEYI